MLIDKHPHHLAGMPRAGQAAILRPGKGGDITVDHILALITHLEQLLVSSIVLLEAIKRHGGTQRKRKHR